MEEERRVVREDEVEETGTCSAPGSVTVKHGIMEIEREKICCYYFCNMHERC